MDNVIRSEAKENVDVVPLDKIEHRKSQFIVL
jgi:hypothetical protein